MNHHESSWRTWSDGVQVGPLASGGVEIARWLERHAKLVQMPRWLALDDLDLAKDGGGGSLSDSPSWEMLTRFRQM